MTASKMKRILPLAALMLVMVSLPVRAQFSNTYYHMFGVPQANQLNPAFQPNCDGYLAMPLMGPLRFETESNGLRYKDIISKHPTRDQFITFMHPDATASTKAQFFNALRPLNVIRFEAGASLLSTGWRKENFYFTLDFSERIEQGISLPKDFAEFALYGNSRQTDFDFTGMANDSRYYHELALGASYGEEDEFQVGGRIKLLLGGGNVNTRVSDIFLRTDVEEWTIKSEMEINATLPYFDISTLDTDQDGYLILDSLDNVNFEDLFLFPDDPKELISGSNLSTLTGIKNPGIALDAGFNYAPIDRLWISLSLIDLGFIRWGGDAYTLEQEMRYSFNGIEIDNQFLTDEDYDPLDGVLDSIKSVTRIRITETRYRTALSGKVFFGAAYDLTEKVRFGGVFRTRINNYNFYNQLTLSANVMPISMFSASVSYSIYNNNYMNMGLGLSMRLGPLNLYFITDQAPSVYFFPESFSSMNFRLGMNIVWGCRKLPKAMKDRPLIE